MRDFSMAAEHRDENHSRHHSQNIEVFKEPNAYQPRDQQNGVADHAAFALYVRIGIKRAEHYSGANERNSADKRLELREAVFKTDHRDPGRDRDSRAGGGMTGKVAHNRLISLIMDYNLNIIHGRGFGQINFEFSRHCLLN